MKPWDRWDRNGSKQTTQMHAPSTTHIKILAHLSLEPHVAHSPLPSHTRLSTWFLRSAIVTSYSRLYPRMVASSARPPSPSLQHLLLLIGRTACDLSLLSPASPPPCFCILARWCPSFHRFLPINPPSSTGDLAIGHQEGVIQRRSSRRSASPPLSSLFANLAIVRCG